MDFGKFKYEATRIEREARRDQRANGGVNTVKEVRLKTRIGVHDRLAKTRNVKRLLGDGYKVRVSVSFRGREITHPEVGMAVLRLVAEDLKEDALMEKAPAFEGRFLAMTLIPSVTGLGRRPPIQAQEKEPAQAQAQVEKPAEAQEKEKVAKA